MKCNCENCKGKEVEVLLYEARVFLDKAEPTGEAGSSEDATLIGVSFHTTGAVTHRLKDFITGKMFDAEESPMDDAIMDSFVEELQAIEKEYLDKITMLITKTTGDYSAMKYVAKSLTGGLQ